MTTHRTSPTFLYAYRSAPWRTQLQVVGVIALVVVMVGIVAGVYLNVTARAATVGREIQEWQLVKLEMMRTNADLQTELAALRSAERMQMRALELGFVPLQPGQIVYLEVDGYSARAEVVIAPAPALSPAESVALPSAFTLTLLDWMDDFATQPDGGLRQAVTWLEPLITVTPEVP